MKRSHFVQGLLPMVSALTLCGACTEPDAHDDSAEPALASLAASARSTAELGVTGWEVRADGAETRIIGRGAAASRQVEMIVQRDAAAPEDRVRIEAVFPEHGVFQLTRAGVIEGAASDYLQRLGADVHADLGSGSAPVAADDGLGTARSALTIDNQGVIHLGWNLWGYTFNTNADSWCRNGTTRLYAQVYSDYGAECSVVGWATDSASDCTIRLHMSVGNGHWDDFHWTVYTTP